MATLSQPETSTKPAWTIVIVATARMVIVIVGIGRLRMVCGRLCRHAQESPNRPPLA